MSSSPVRHYKQHACQYTHTHTQVGMHVIPGQRLFPLAQLRDGLALDTAADKLKVYIRRE